MTYGLGNRPDADATNESVTSCVDRRNDSAEYLALLAEKMPDLAAVVEAWPTLPAALRSGIVAMVNAADRRAE